MNYASTANIVEVMKFYKLGDKTFETDFCTQLVKSHGDDLGLEYLWNEDEYGSLGNSLKAMEKNAEHGGQPEI